MKVHIHELREADLATVICNFTQMFPWRDPHDVVNEITSSLSAHAKHSVLVAKVDGEIAAIGSYGINPISANCWHLYLSATLPKHRRLGINAHLVADRLYRIGQQRTAPGTNILVATKRPTLFAKFGFKEIGPNGSSTLMVHHLE